MDGFEIVLTVENLSGQFSNRPDSSLIVWTVFIPYVQFLKAPDSFLTVRTVSKLSGQFLNRPDSF